MNNLLLYFSTGQVQIDEILRGSIGILEALFPGRIRAYYLVGSYADGSYIESSDLDLVPVFVGAMQEGEASLYRQAVADLNRLSHGNPGRLSTPLDYPDARDPYYGYVKAQQIQGKKRKSLAPVFTYLMFLASTIVTLRTGRYNASKSFSWKFYQDNIQDAWGTFLEDWYVLGKQTWRYRVPRQATERARLRELCRQVLAFENEFLQVVEHYTRSGKI